MNAPPSLHPTDRTLGDYGLGKLEAAAAAAVHAHLEGCPACRRRTSEMTSDSFLGKFRDGRSSAGSLMGPGGAVPTRSIDGADLHAPDALPPGLADHKDYTVLRELGRGGMGVVYLAENTLMGRMEVLKVIGRSMTERPEVLDRFLREIRSVARLRHPNIVAAYHAFRIEAGLVFAMEHVDGFDLSKMVKNRGPLPVAHACLFAHQAALGLQHAHEEGMVHRDIKPGNLMVSRRGEKAVVKILDFGLAKATSEGQLDAGLTHEGQMLGTPDFIAPEQIVDAQKADIRADIYSLGCTLYYLLSGGPPFRGTSLYDLFQAHHSIDAKPLNFARPEVPTELAALVAKMMAKEPERRFRTPADVAEALVPFTRKGGVTLKPVKPDVTGAEMPVVKRRAAPPPAGPPAPASKQGPPPSMPPGPEKPEARWSSLIDFRERGPEAVEEPRPLPRLEGPPRRRRARPAAAAGVLLFGLLAAWMGGVIRHKTPGGTIVVEGIPENSDTYVDEKLVRVAPPGGAEPFEFSVAPGKHKIRVRRGDLTWDSDDIEVIAGEKTAALRVYLEKDTAGGAVAGVPAIKPPTQADEGPVAVVPTPGRSYRFVNVATGRALDVQGASRRVAALVQADVSGSESQLWELRAAKKAGTYFVVNKLSRLAINISNQSKDHYPVIQYPLESAGERPTNEHWIFRGDGESFRIFSPWSRHVIVARNPGASGDPVVQVESKGGRDELWRLVEAPAAAAGGGPVPRPTVDSGTWTIEGDELVQSNGETDARMAFGDPEWSDYDLTLEAQKVEGAGHGLEVMFHRTARRSFAWFGLGVFENKGCEMYFEKDAKGARASDNNPDNWVGHGVNVGEWYSIKLEVRKSHFKSYLDGMLMFEGTHRDHTQGRIGLNTGKIRARFRKIKVTAPGGGVLFEGIPEIYSVGKVPAPALAVKAPATPLFNGKDLTGWTDVLPNGSEWKVVDGVLEGRGSGKPGGHGLLVSRRQDLKNYRLRAQLRIRGRGWGGTVEIRRTSVGELASGYIVSLCQWPTAPVATAGSLGVLERHADGAARDGWFEALPTPIAVDEWFDVTVDVYGNTFVTSVNGRRVCEYTDPDGLHPSGAIALTCGPQAAVQYRSITLEEWADGPGAASVPAPATAVRPPTQATDPARRTWAGSGMTFENFEPGRWREVSEVHRRIFYYRESGRTGRSVELFNPYRGQGGIWVRLGDGRGEVKPGSQRGWEALADGRWTSTPPAVARVATPEAIRRLEEDVRKFRDPARTAARGDAFKEVVDGLIADFEARLAPLRAAPSGDASGLMAWTKAVRDSPVFRTDPAEEARSQAEPGFVNRAREAQKQLGEASYDVESLGASDGTGAFVPLFNGKDLGGWHVATDPDHRWSVGGGVLISAAPATYSRLDTKREDFANFHLRLETMLAEGVDGAVDVRLEKDGDTPGFYAAAVAGTDSQGSRTGSLQLWVSGKRNDVATASEAPIKPGEWFRMEIVAVDDTITVLVAGNEVARYKDPDRTHTAGSIGLFCRPGATMRFRNIEIKELPAVEEPAAEPLGALDAAPAPAATAASANVPARFVDEFNNGTRGLPADPNAPHEPRHGRTDGVFFVYHGSGFLGQNVHPIASDSTCEVVGRVLSTDPRKTASWAACVVRQAEPHHGFLVRINVKGELFLEPNPYKGGLAFRQIDARLGPITHPAIGPGSGYNKLQLVIKGRELVILVNGSQVCPPVKLDYDPTPARLSLAAVGPGMKRADFERIEIREIVEPKRVDAKAR